MAAVFDSPDQIIFPGSVSVDVPHMAAAREAEELNETNIWRAKYAEWFIEYQVVRLQMSFHLNRSVEEQAIGFSVPAEDEPVVTVRDVGNIEKARALVTSWKEEEEMNRLSENKLTVRSVIHNFIPLACFLLVSVVVVQLDAVSGWLWVPMVLLQLVLLFASVKAWIPKSPRNLLKR